MKGFVGGAHISQRGAKRNWAVSQLSGRCQWTRKERQKSWEQRKGNHSRDVYVLIGAQLLQLVQFLQYFASELKVVHERRDIER